MFKVLICLKEVGKYDTFSEAFKEFFTRIKYLLDSGTSWHTLETTNFIEYHGDLNGESFVGVMNFYAVEDFAHKVGLLLGKGELKDPLPDIDPMVVRAAFLEANTDYLLQIICSLNIKN